MQTFERSSVGAIDFSSSPNWRWTRFFLSLLGAWPLQSQTDRRMLTVSSLILLGSMFIPEVLELIAIRKNINQILVCIPNLTFHVLTLLIIMNFCVNSRMMRVLLLRIQKDWQSLKHGSETEIIMNDQHDHVKILASYIYFVSFVTVLFVIVPSMPVIFDQIKPLNESRPRTIVYHTKFYFDEEKYDVPMLIHSIIFMPLPTTALIAFDSMFATSIQHACSIFKVVGTRLQFSMDNIKYQKTEQDCSMLQSEIRKTLVESIRMHEDIFQFVDLLQGAFSTSLFVMNFMSMMNLSMSAYQAISNLDNSAEAVRLSFFSTAQLTRLYFRCWHGQKLINSSDSTGVLVYQGNWHNLPLRLRRFIILILARGRKQCRITAGGVFDMSMENFLFVVKTASSYFTVLRSMQ